MQKRSLGPFAVTAIGLAAMPMSWNKDNEIPGFRSSQKELEFCAERSIAFLPWSPLGGTGGAGRQVGERFAVFSEIARGHGVSPQQVVLAWELSLGSQVMPIPGARRPESIMDSAKAASLVLSDAELARCSASGGSG